MQTFANGREAKEFLIGKLLAQARRDDIDLSEIERKMLYFSETAWTLPDATEVNEEFERDYDSRKYEQKIAGLAQRYSKAPSQEDAEALASWKEAIRKLLEEDHYLLVLIQSPQRATRDVADRLKLIATALAIVGAVVIVMFLFSQR